MSAAKTCEARGATALTCASASDGPLSGYALVRSPQTMTNAGRSRLICSTASLIISSSLRRHRKQPREQPSEGTAAGGQTGASLRVRDESKVGGSASPPCPRTAYTRRQPRCLIGDGLGRHTRSTTRLACTFQAGYLPSVRRKRALSTVDPPAWQSVDPPPVGSHPRHRPWLALGVATWTTCSRRATVGWRWSTHGITGVSGELWCDAPEWQTAPPCLARCNQSDGSQREPNNARK